MIAGVSRVLRAFLPVGLPVGLPVVLVLGLVAAVYPATVPSSPASALSAYLPSGLRHGRIATVPTGEVWQTNQATKPALDAFAELPGDLAEALGYADDPDAPELQGRWLLVDLLPPGGDGSVQTLAFLVAPRRISLQAIVTPHSWTAYAPGLPVLDADVIAGGPVSWAGTTTRAVGGAKPLTRRALATVSVATNTDPACVDTTVRLRPADAGTANPSTRVSTWCRADQTDQTDQTDQADQAGQAGWAGDVVDGTGVVATTKPPAARTEPDLDVDDDGATPRSFTGQVAPVQHYRLVNEQLTRTSADGPRTVGRAGSVLVSVGSDGQVDGWSPVEKPLPGATEDYLRWRAQPGGRATALTTVGTVTVVADSANRVTAWAGDGWQLWQRPTDDLAISLAPVGRGVVVGEADGRVRLLDAATGAERWSHDLGGRSSVAASAGHVAVLTGDLLTVFDARTGQRRWDRDLGGRALVAMLGELVVVKEGTWLAARSAASGAVVWWQAAEGVAASMTATDEQLVLVGAAATTGFGPDGRKRWSTAPAQTVRLAGAEVVLTYADRVELWNAAGRRQSWSYPTGYGPPVDQIVRTATGVRLYQPSDEGGRWWEYR